MIWNSTNVHIGLMALISECKQPICSFHEFRATHVYQEANGATDGMAKLAVVGTLEGCLNAMCCNYFDSLPSGLDETLLADILRVQHPRLVCVVEA